MNILLLAHKFPPYIGVGANRWHHLANALAGMGHQLHVVTVERVGATIMHPNIFYHYVPLDIFQRIHQWKFKNALLHSIFYRIVNRLSMLFCYDDELQFWGPKVKSVCRGILDRHEIDLMIATGHPFQANRIAAELKKERPSLKLIQDFRDVWSDNPFKPYLFAWQKKQVEKWERFAISSADMNVFVTKSFERVMNKNYSSKIAIISNGHNFEWSCKQAAKENYLIHVGTLANGREVMAEPFFELCLTNPAVLRGNQVHFYGRVHNGLLLKYRKLFRDGVFQQKDIVRQEILAGIISKAKVGLQFNAAEYWMAQSTKVFEYPALQTPVLSVNGGGEVETLFSRYQVGESVGPHVDVIKQALENLLSGNVKYDFQDFAQKYHFRNLAKKYASLAEALINK